MSQKGAILPLLIVVIGVSLAGFVYYQNLLQTQEDTNTSENNPTTTNITENNSPTSFPNNGACGHNLPSSSSKVVSKICFYTLEYTGPSQLTLEFPASWTFDIVGANVDNILLSNQGSEIFVGLVSLSSDTSDTLDEVYWQDTDEDAEKHYAIPRDKKELSRDDISLDDKNVAKLNYDDKTMYVMFDFPNNKNKAVFRIEVNSSNERVLNEVEKMISSFRFESNS